MFPSWRLKIRDARRALKAGRWDEAARLLEQPSLREFWPARKPASQLAGQLLQRARDHITRGDTSAGWHDLQQAARLGGRDETIATLRNAHYGRGLAKVRRCLRQAEPQGALDELDRLDRQQPDRSASQPYRLVAQRLLQVERQVSRGQMLEAANGLQRAARLVPVENSAMVLSDTHRRRPADDPHPDETCVSDGEDGRLRAALEAREKSVRAQAQPFRQLQVELHQALGEEDWPQVLVTAEAMLELASEHNAARQARRRAWQAVAVKATLSYHPNNGRNRPWRRKPSPSDSQVALAWQESPATYSGSIAMVDVKIKKEAPGGRLVVWIDAVGGYLLCLADQVSLGQASPCGKADISIQADLSRRHAVICREGESYVLTPIHTVRVDGVKLTGPRVLRDQALLQLGDSVQLRFHRPHALSATALLIPESHHRIEPAVDAIVLMADNCILGPRDHAHIRCRHWPDDLVLVGRGKQLKAHTQMSLEVDGRPYDPQADLVGIGRLENDSIGLSIEELVTL